jgi:hypothetical protein
MADKAEKPTQTAARARSFDPGRLRPSEFMRARRPERFADSRIIEEPKLTPAVFEYHLNSLTSRKQETEFEHFARRLAERMLCPNLLPQTGPTGGGDSKVDAETYPVAEEIALRWYEGVDNRANQERWAFAFSAKQQWQGKLEDDVEKIVKTGRNYKQIYFITNQFVKDKKRAEVEDSLTNTVGIPVHIMDRSWIMKCIFENRLAPIAIETLHMTGYETAFRKEVGPNDARREAKLKQLDEEIADPGRYQGSPYQLGEDCLRSALLARGLERSRIEIEGRFARAEKVARTNNHTQQRLRIAYNKAWTAYWWFEDFDQLNLLYDEVEALAATTEQADDLELLSNLRTILGMSIVSGALDANTAKFEIRNATLRKVLSRLAKDGSRPNNALWAHTQLLLMDLQDSLGSRDRLREVISEFTNVLDSAKGLISYPIEPVTKILRELGDVVTDDPTYDDLLERVVKILEERASKGEAGRILLERGFQKLKGKKPYDSIVLFGRAQQLLALREYRGELIAALLGAGLAYEAVGLLWAARANTLAAANQAASDYIEEGRVTTLFLSCLQKMVWLELQLGRIPATLQWIDVTSVIAKHLALSGEDKQRYVDQREMQDGVLAILSRLSWNWRKRSFAKIAERTYEKRAQALRRRRESSHPEATPLRPGPSFRAV